MDIPIYNTTQIQSVRPLLVCRVYAEDALLVPWVELEKYFIVEQADDDAQPLQCAGVVWCMPERPLLHFLIGQCARDNTPLCIVRPHEELDFFRIIERHYKHVFVVDSSLLGKRAQARKFVARIVRATRKRNCAQEHTYKFTLRLPQSLDSQIARRAREEGTTKARLVRTILESSLTI